MKRMRILGLCLVAVFAFAAIAAASASAVEPEWASCQKTEPKNTGNFSDKLCSIAAEGGPGTGKYEIVPGVGKGKGFKSKGEKSALHTVIPGKGDIPVECEAFKATGKVAPPNKQFEVKATFKKCTTLSKAVPCQNIKKGTIETNALAGELHYINAEAKVVGADLTSQAEPGSGLTVEFECTGVAKVRVHGAVIAVQSGDINTISKTSTDTYAIGPFLGPQPYACENPETKEMEECKFTPQVNIPKFEGGPLEVLMTELNGPETENEWAPEGGLPSGQEGVANNKGEALMVKA